MSEEKKDWNAVFAQRKAAHDASRAHRLSQAKSAADGTGKQAFDPRAFKKLYEQLNPDDVDRNTPWKTLLRDAEFDYYVTEPTVMSLKQLVLRLKWLQGFG